MPELAHQSGTDRRAAGSAADSVPSEPDYRVVRIRVGSGCLEVITNLEWLLGDLDAQYGDCVVPEAVVPGPVVRCTVSSLPDGHGVSLFLDGRDLPDLIDVVLGLFMPLAALQCYVERPDAADGWRVIVNADADDRLLIATAGRAAVLDLTDAPPDFLLDCLVAVLHWIQPGLLFVHAASVGVDDSGVLLVGPSRAGKSTTSVALASLGHAFFGDDAATLRIATREVVPFPKSIGVRDETLARSLGLQVRGCRHRREASADGTSRLLVRVGDAVPLSLDASLPLRFAFFLDGFCDVTRVRPFRPGLDDLHRLRWLAGDVTASWGVSPGRQLMKYLTVVDLLVGAQCFLVDLGPPMEVARTIERVVRGT